MKLTDRFGDALSLSFKLHKEQIRRTPTVPFMAHLLGVASLVIDDGGSEDEAIAALLHDSLEDQGDKISIKDIERDFGSKVAGIVRECTENKKINCRQKRRQLFIQELPKKSQGAIRVIAADKVHSIMSLRYGYQLLGEEMWKNFKSSKEDLLDYYKCLSEKLGKNLESPLCDEAKKQYQLLIEAISD